MKTNLKRTNFEKLKWLTFLVFFNLTSASLLISQGDGLPRGAYQMPYIRYESEDANYGGGAVYHEAFDFDQEKMASEASNQQYVGLPSNGSYVQWTVNEAGRGVTMRFTLPDNESTGEGNTGSLDVYVNNVKVKTVDLTSRYAWQYFRTGEDKCYQLKSGTDKTRMRFDEVHFALDNSLNSGDVIKIQKGSGDVFEYGVDFIEIEPIPAVKAAPANSLSVVDYGANGNDANDDLAAFHACLDAADAAGKNVYIPPGKYYLSAKLNFNVTDLKFQGAGEWYTELYFSTDLQFSGGIYARCSNVVISDFYLHTANNDRWNYNEPFPEGSIGEYKTYKGFMGTYGNNSIISNVWVEHFECGAWIAGYDAPLPVDITSNLTMRNMRIRNNYADGVNFCQGTNNSVVEHSNIRNSGDDGLAVWPNNAMGVSTPGSNNTFRYNTIENQWRAGGTALFGASGHKVHHSIYKDGFASSAIRLTTDFSGYKFDINTGIEIYENTIIHFGTSDDLWNCERGAIELNATNGGISNVSFDNIDIVGSQRHGIQFGSGGGYSNITLNNINIDGTGFDDQTQSCFAIPLEGAAVFAYASSGGVTFNNLTYSNIENNPAIYKTSDGFKIDTNWIGDIPLREVILPEGPIDIVSGETISIVPTFIPDQATNQKVLWSSSNPSVGVVDPGSQSLTGLSTGTTVITVTTEDGGFTDEIVINVTAAVNIEAVDDIADENGNTGEFVISISELTSTINVAYIISSSSTASINDYISSPALSGTVTLSPLKLSESIVITPLADSELEGTESLTLTLVDGSGYSIGGMNTASVAIQDKTPIPCGAPNIALTDQSPVIDNSVDAVWGTVDAVSISNVTIGSMPADFSGSYKAIFDYDNLYLLVTVSDNVINNNSGTEWWLDDVVNIFIDGDNSKGTSYDGVNDFQLGFRWNDNTIQVGGNSVQSTTGIQFNMSAISGGYQLEVAIPWATIGVTPVLNNQIGIDVIIDDDDSGSRDAQIAAFSTTEMAWSNPSLFGTVYLATCGNVVIAKAGEDQNLAKGTTSTTLDGSQSSGEGSLSYLWTLLSGANVNIVNPNSASTSVSGLVDGNIYTFQLTVSDGETSVNDAVIVKVASNQAPSVSVSSVSVQLPENSATLVANANDPDGSISSYVWLQVSGPTSPAINEGTTSSISVSGLEEGIYVYEVTVTDNDGATATAQASITVSETPVYPTDRGYYNAPYTRYEASSTTIGGGATLIGPSFDQKSASFEASDRVCASLSNNGAYTEWTTIAAGQGLVMRFSIPDAPSGGGINGSLGLYVNGTKLQDINVSSKWAWQYFSASPYDGTKDPTNTPSAGYTARMAFDEVRVLLPNSLPKGTVIKIQKDNGDAINYLVDFVELEPVDAPKAKPANSLDITDYGAIPNDGVDDKSAFDACYTAARSQGKGIYFPEGKFEFSAQFYLYTDGLVFTGAGMWHTELYFTNASPGNGGFNPNATNLTFSDFYMNTENTTRALPYKGFVGKYGTGSKISNVWVEHFECGAWISNYHGNDIADGLEIVNCRFRNTYADGVNFSKGTSNSICHYSSFRNNGDDAMASWSSSDGPVCLNNTFAYCTAENTWRAAGVGFFGGGGHKAHHIIVKDNVEAGLRINSDFQGQSFTGDEIVFEDITVIGSGTNANLWFNRYGAIDIFTRLYNMSNVTFRNIDVLDSQKDAIFIYTVNPAYTITGLRFENLTVAGTGLDGNLNNYTDGTWDDYAGYGILTDGQVQGEMVFCNVHVVNSASEPAIYQENPDNFVITYDENCSQVIVPESITVSPTSLNLLLGESASITATVLPAEASQSVSWFTSNGSVASVSAGIVNANGVGSAIITARTTNGLEATCTVIVTDNRVYVTGIAVNPTSVTLTERGANYQLIEEVLPADATNQSVIWTSSDVSIATVSSTGVVTAIKDGDVVITVTTDDGGFSATSAISCEIPEPVQTPYGGTAWNIPGTIEAENFDDGGQDVAYYDADAANNGGQYRTEEAIDIESCNAGGYNVGWTSAGEWMEYTVNVEQAGDYDFEIRVASTMDAGTFHIEFDGVDVTRTITSINTGAWQTWTSVTVRNVALSAGEQIMRIVMDNPNHNIDKVIITKSDDNGGNTGGTYYKIKNVWQGTYLFDNGNNVSYSTSNDGDIYLWKLIQLSDGYYEIQNAETGEYMHIENLMGSIQCNSRTEGWYSSRWTIINLGNSENNIRNAWQSDNYIHIEYLQGNAQHGTINQDWLSAKWIFEPIQKSAKQEHLIESTIHSDIEIKIYPNPAVNEINLKTYKNIISNVTISDLSGKKIKTYQSEQNKSQVMVDVSDLNEGMYLITITDNVSYKYVCRFIKNK